ncbi:hypothetical protein LIER_20532 [Lithospermum erythrorhizon]|uniref:Uncharacterized protein n=1 Tax=Lithospermum erythrorhizon TaxID=34254 RepID=A0AAV3QP70_LITER
MAHTKCSVVMRHSPPLKRSKSAGGVKFASPSSPTSERPVVALMSPILLPNRAAHDSLLPLLYQGVVQRKTLELGEELSQECLKVEALEQELQGLCLQAAKASHHRWEFALLAQDLKRAEEERDPTYRPPVLPVERERNCAVPIIKTSPSGGATLVPLSYRTSC